MITITIGDCFIANREPATAVFDGFDWIQHDDLVVFNFTTVESNDYYGFSPAIDEE